VGILVCRSINVLARKVAMSHVWKLHKRIPHLLPHMAIRNTF
jgi:hypothetical protein